MKIADLITDALTEIRVARAGDVLSPEDQALGLLRLNRILDRLNLDEGGVWTVNFQTFTITPNLQPHTIGPTGTWTVPRRPQRIVGANLVLNTSTPNVLFPIRIVDDQWWLQQPVPALSTAIPEALYYSPDWTQDGTPDNGSCYFWPVPNTAYDIRLELAVTLAPTTVTETFSLPPGYQELLTLMLAEDLSGSFGQPVTPDLARRVSQSKAAVLSRNVRPIAVASRDSGMPGGDPGGDYVFWLGPMSGARP